MSALIVGGVTKQFAAVQALDDVSFDVGAGEFFSIVGPTNAGKSTLLKTIAGIHRPDAGRISIGERNVTDLRPAERNVSLLFQKIALFPMLTGFENIAFALRQAGVGAEQINEQVLAVAQMLGIAHILERLPRTFSGGEQQRTAIGRALVRPGDVLMLDEPLTNLDARTRTALRLEFKKLHQVSGQTILHVTHDQAEAMSLSDRIAVLHLGRLQQIGSPDEIYHRPVNRFVATFVGSPPINILDVDVRMEDRRVELLGDGFAIDLASTAYSPAKSGALPQNLSIAVRPESIAVGPAPAIATPIGAQITWVENLGRTRIITLRVGRNTIQAITPAHHPVRAEGRAWIGFLPRKQHILNRDTGEFIR